jgi:hypothetical protein
MTCIQVALLLALFALLEGCASTFQAKPEQPSAFLEDNAKFGILADAVVPHVHARMKINWSAYDKVYLKPIIIEDGFASRLSGEQKEDLRPLANSFYEMIYQRLSQDYAMVEHPAPGAMAVQVAITHAERSWLVPQFLSKVSWQLQALNSVLTYFREKPAFAGEITIGFTIHDSMTGELLFAGTDRRVGGQNLFDKEVFNSWGDVQNSLEFGPSSQPTNCAWPRQRSNCSKPKA